MKRFPMKKLVITSLTAVMVLGGGTSAFAKDSKDWKESRQNENDHDNGNGWHGQKGRVDFKDIQGRDMEWALRYIASLASRNIFDGYSDGTFRPYEKVTRIEAITAAVRLMGLRDQAESAAEMQTKLNFKDANQVPSWAVGYVSVALKNDLFSESETMVQPNQPSDRLWATTLLVKALKLGSEAKTKMNVKLPFSDAGKIPAGSVGYVAVAVEQGLVNGFEDNTFRPMQPVTRAEIAALLDRAGDQLSDSSSGLVVGTVATPVANNVLTLNKGGQMVTLTLDPGTFIYRGGAKVGASALQVGDVVRTRSYNNVVIFVEVTSYVGTWPNQPTQPTLPSGVNTGTLTSVVNNNTFTVTNGSQTVSLPLNADALFFRNGTQVNSSALQIGDIVSTRAYNNAVIYVEVTQPAGSTGTQPTYSRQVTGTVVSTGSNVLTLVNGGQLESLALNNGALIYRSGSKVSSSSLQAGDIVTTYAYNNMVAIAEVTRTAVQPSTTNGTITGTVAVPSYGNALIVTSGSQNISLNLDSNAFIFRAGGQSGPGALQPGDVITVRYYNNSVIYAEVTQLAGGSTSQPAVSETTGTLLTTLGNNTLTILNGGQTSTLTLYTNVFILRNGVKVNASDLQIGDIINIRSYNNAVIFVEVTQNGSNSNQSFTVVGTFSSKTLNSQGQLYTISINQTNMNGTTQTIVYSVAPSVTIYGDASRLVANQQVVLQGTGQTVTKIYIQ
ncbi:S-layer homology domain-containing protein [Paenibacillus filicis]|uniref:S-layer homology domain-containing protein n=1 Tax=Paenibacillus gyeongsangnamensis TaxID=3388067 RepID=A0ABT4QE56_9BACL|nr:S-layer homology domain-containing protein [Paenibacillus filicis]MCZ8515168.1 S-layer homology domain-containing protein [Paenibacillus filicis]